MEKLTIAMENYLEAIYELTRGGMGARLTDIAERMGVTKASANNAVGALAERGLVINEKYQEIYLTQAGVDMAASTNRKHMALFRFFTQVLGVDEPCANDNACAIEHVISDEVIQAMQAYMRKKPARR